MGRYNPISVAALAFKAAAEFDAAMLAVAPLSRDLSDRRQTIIALGIELDRKPEVIARYLRYMASKSRLGFDGAVERLRRRKL